MTPPLLPIEERALALIGLGLLPGAATVTRLRVGLDVQESTVLEVVEALEEARLIKQRAGTWGITERGRLYLAGHPAPRPQPTPQDRRAGVAA